MPPKQDILLCDLDAFFASVEQLDNPDLKGKPLIIGGSPEGRGVVSTCSYEARKYGVRSAMPMRKAVKLCPQATVLSGNMSRYKEVSDQVVKVFYNFTPDIMPVSIDEAYLGLKEGTGFETAKLIRAAVREELGLPISIGVSANMLLAKIACELAKPDNLKTIRVEDVPHILWPLPVDKLPGIGPTSRAKLNRLGIKTVKDLAVYPERKLTKLLGNNALTLKSYAHGIDNRKITAPGEVKSISKETTFHEDVYSRDHISAILYELSEEVGYRLRARKLQAKTVSVKIRFADFKTITRDKTLPEPTDLDSTIFENANELFERHGGKPPWRLIGVKLAGLESWRQLSFFAPDPSADKERKVASIKDGLRDKYGRGIITGARKFKK